MCMGAMGLCLQSLGDFAKKWQKILRNTIIVHHIGVQAIGVIDADH